MTFILQLENHWNCLCDSIFKTLSLGESLSFSLTAENTFYVRFNGALVRQNTVVQQCEISATLQKDQKRFDFAFFISGEFQNDLSLAQTLIQQARQELGVLYADPFMVEMTNSGQSRENFEGTLLSEDIAISKILDCALGLDFVGLYAAGPMVRASRNSKGQTHWFSTESFFLDYSLYTKNSEGLNKAVKGSYSSLDWSDEEFSKRLNAGRAQLHLLEKKSVVVKKGSYRTYLAPAAVAELVSMFSWRALSYKALKTGSCALHDLYEGKKEFSPLFSLNENFTLGLSPRFNPFGEVAPQKLVLIHKGRGEALLVSARTAKEYSVVSNAAAIGAWGSEYLRSPEILPGELHEDDILKTLGTGVYLGNLHYLNWSDVSSARLTGMTRYACFWVEDGEIVGPINDLRFDESLYSIFGSALESLTVERSIDPVTDTYSQRNMGGKKVPGALLKSFTFTL